MNPLPEIHPPPARRRLTVPEYATRAFPRLDVEEASALAASKVVRVSADLRGRTLLTAGPSVGVVTAGGVELRVTPRIGIRRLLWLLGFARNPDGWRHDDAVHLTDTEDLVPAMAISFLDAANRALARGVLQDYHQREEALPVLRGRLCEAEQFRRHLGLPVPLEVRYDDYDADIPENRVLHGAARLLLRLPGVPETTRRGLRHLTVVLADATPVTPGQLMPTIRRGRRNRHYGPALDLAALVMSGRSIDQYAGAVRATGFVFELHVVFEQWLGAALRHALRPYGGSLAEQWRDHLDVLRAVPVRPDLVWHHNRRPVAVADAKYKVLDSTERPHADLYQLLAYCTLLGLSTGHLVYAQGDSPRATHTVRRAGVTLNTWALDLTAPVTELLGRVDELAVAMAEQPSLVGFVH